MNKREVYLEAARLIAEREAYYCCWALDAAANDIWSESRRSFKQIFGPPTYPYGGYGYWWGKRATKKSQLARSLALLFMAEMVRTGDL